MKNRILSMALIAMAVLSLASCKKKDSLMVSSQDLWFNLEAGSQTITLTANCDWSIVFHEQTDWYTVSPTSGTANDSIITVTVKAYPDGDFRGSYFVINSPGGHIRRTVFVSQNKLDFDGDATLLIHKGYECENDPKLLEVEPTNAEERALMGVIEETYKHKEYDPYDTTTGYLMYFLEDGIGVQRDHHKDTVIYYAFTYDYTPYNQNLYIEFETVDGGPEPYNAQVLCASDSLYRIFHEFKPMQFERADHRKIGTIIPAEKEALKQKALQYRAIKRNGREGIYHMD